MYCKTRYRVRDLNCLSSQDLGGIFYITWVLGLGGTTGKCPGGRNRKGQANSFAWQEGLIFINFMKRRLGNIKGKVKIDNYKCSH